MSPRDETIDPTLDLHALQLGSVLGQHRMITAVIDRNPFLRLMFQGDQAVTVGDKSPTTLKARARRRTDAQLTEAWA